MQFYIKKKKGNLVSWDKTLLMHLCDNSGRKYKAVDPGDVMIHDRQMLILTLDSVFGCS